ncbi:S8 family peptidase [[Clostridium] polysaccharolyticum]|uniref:Subtilase family protein n=1 Tax=[Clostridium] polysaccharolyticum TaxID=29364 RepID=A0A1H9YMM4_9FIRM|nr:S8 family peptidase [[Clostridium] polysaccharolyticum]SES69863.1 Subtilase family protein [[Clostridium] polysaccharolyticum]
MDTPNQQFDPVTCENAIYSEEYLPLLIDYAGDFQQIIDRYKPVCYVILSVRQAIIYVYIGSAKIWSQNFTYRSIPKVFGLMDTAVLEQTGVLKLRRQPYIDLYGQDVLIGFLDTGIDYRNPVFRNADGTTRIEAIWDQSIPDGEAPDNFFYGSEYGKEQINQALESKNPLEVVPSMDTNGHGTFMAGVAAGNIDENNNFSGIAPNCEIIMVKLRQARKKLRNFFLVNDNVDCYAENDILTGMSYLIKKAEQLGKPIVICIGVGTNSGDHNGSSPLGRFIDYFGFVTGIVFVGGTGNEGNRGHHYESSSVLPEDFEELEINVGENVSGFSLELWATTPALFAIGFTSPSGEVIDPIQPRLNKKETIRFVLEKTVLELAYYIIEAGAGDFLVFMRFDSPAKGVWKIRAYNRSPVANSFNMWLPIQNFIPDSIYFNQPEPNVTITEPGNATTIITVSVYNGQTDSMYIHSGRGFTRGGKIQPAAAAPGVSVFGPLLNNQFGRKTGSSVSAAVGAAIAALLLEWAIVQGNDDDANSNVIRQYIVIGAREREIVYPNREWGYGEIDIFSIFERLRT